jgi:Protein kinase domain
VSLQPGDVFAGHRIDAIAGRGGMGIVYRATHLALDLTIALKVIAPEFAQDVDFRARFQRESRLAASLEHPHIIPIRHAGEEEGLLYITMRFVEGIDLRQAIAARGRLPPELAVSVVGQVAEALDAAHRAGLVHRDVKPANVLLEGEGGEPWAYLTDFGLTRHQQASARLTKTGEWMGTLDYVAPEQIRNESVDGRTDIYSLGCVLYQALIGEVPFPRDSEVATLYAQLEEVTPPLAGLYPGISRELEAVVHKATAKRPADRYASGSELIADAEGALVPPTAPLPPEPASTKARTTRPEPARRERAAADKGTTKVGPPATTGTAPQTERRDARRRGALIAGGLGVLAVAVAIFALAGGGGGGEDSPAGSGGAGAATTGSDPVSAFRAEADAICTEMEAGVEDAYAQVEEEAGGYDASGVATIPQSAQIDFLATRAGIVRDGLEQLRQLAVPESQQAEFSRYLGLRSDFADQLVALRGALIAGDQSAASSATDRMRGLLEKKKASGARLSLMACADRLPAGERREVEALATDYVTGARSAETCQRLTDDFLQGVFAGSTANCVSREALASDPGSAEIVDWFGVDGVHATVTFAIDGSEVPVFLDHENGGWRIDGVGRARTA